MTCAKGKRFAKEVTWLTRLKQAMTSMKQKGKWWVFQLSTSVFYKVLCVESLILVFHLGRMRCYYCSNIVTFNCVSNVLLALSIFLIQEIAFSQGTLSDHSLKYFFHWFNKSLYIWGPFFSLWPCYLEEWLHSDTMSLTVLHSILKKIL